MLSAQNLLSMGKTRLIFYRTLKQSAISNHLHGYWLRDGGAFAFPSPAVAAGVVLYGCSMDAVWMLYGGGMG
jgi:hypothetical protein